MTSRENIHSITKKVTYKISFLKSKFCHLIFTDKRIIVAYFNPEKALEEYKKQLQKHQDNGYKPTVLIKIGIKFRSSANFYQRYLSMTPDEIMEELAEQL